MKFAQGPGWGITHLIKSNPLVCPTFAREWGEWGIQLIGTLLDRVEFQLHLLKICNLKKRFLGGGGGSPRPL